METLVRALIIFFFLLLAFRFTGKRTLQDLNLFDFVLLLIISETVQQALTDQDYSLTNGIVIICAYLLLDIGLSYVKRNQTMERLLDGLPLLIVQDGTPLVERMQKSRVDSEDVLEAARKLHGLERMDQIKYAVLEKDGSISIIPKQD